MQQISHHLQGLVHVSEVALTPQRPRPEYTDANGANTQSEHLVWQAAQLVLRTRG